MNNTAPEVSDYVHQRYSAMSAEERSLIGIKMFDTVCEIVAASFPIGLSEAEPRREICRRFSLPSRGASFQDNGLQCRIFSKRNTIL
ncbi:MAG: hypothetical protein V3S54_03700 [Woeseiaceae bacterium]|jgi:hypothetical protein